MQCRTKTVVVGRGRMACGVQPSYPILRGRMSDRVR